MENGDIHEGVRERVLSTVGEVCMKAAGDIVRRRRDEFDQRGLLDVVCLKHARIAVVEDDYTMRRTLTRYLERLGQHQVVATASNMSDALDLIGKLSTLGVQVVTVDGDLSGATERKKDGDRIIEEIRLRHPGIVTIGMSGDPLPAADHDVRKPNLSRMLEVIAAL